MTIVKLYGMVLDCYYQYSKVCKSCQDRFIEPMQHGTVFCYGMEKIYLWKHSKSIKGHQTNTIVLRFGFHIVKDVMSYQCFAN